MKKLFYILLVSASVAACKGKKTDMDANKEMVTLSDPAYNSSYLTDTGAVANTDQYTGEVVSGKATVPERTSPVRSSSSSGGGSSAGSSGGSSQGSTASTGTTSEKRGMSKAAKGAIIGGVGGAVAGAVIGKNAKGAIIGGAVGAAGGYIIGRSKDKKDGRVRN